MATVVPPPAEAELHLLTEWGDPSDGPRRRRAGVLSILVHAGVILGLALAPKSLLETPLRTDTRIVTPLVAPLSEPTQKAPTAGKINAEFHAAEIEPQPRIQMPAASPSTTRPQAFRPAPLPAPVMPALPEPPKIESAANAELPRIAQATPQIQPTEQPPKIAFENPTAVPAPEPGQGLRLPRATDAIRGGLRIGSEETGGPGGYGAFVNLPPSPGVQPNNMQLLSDPMGVDFRPYLNVILITVKQNWMSIWPESARMGRSGKVALQFSIDKRGAVPKLVIASSSGVSSLDRAAVAAISQSVPFPPLPRGFRGDLIKLQLNFAYNTK